MNFYKVFDTALSKVANSGEMGHLPLLAKFLFGVIKMRSKTRLNVEMLETREVPTVSVGKDFLISANTSASTSANATSENGQSVVVWRQQGRVGEQIRGHLFDPAGKPIGSEFKVASNGFTLGAPTVGMEPDGSFVVVWERRGGIVGQTFTAAGKPSGKAFFINPSGTVHNPHIAIQPGGNFVVAFDSSKQKVEQGFDGISTITRTQVYAAVVQHDGKVTKTILLSSATSQPQTKAGVFGEMGDFTHSFNIATSTDGHIALAYTTFSADSSVVSFIPASVAVMSPTGDVLYTIALPPSSQKDQIRGYGSVRVQMADDNSVTALVSGRDRSASGIGATFLEIQDFDVSGNLAKTVSLAGSLGVAQGFTMDGSGTHAFVVSVFDHHFPGGTLPGDAVNADFVFGDGHLQLSEVSIDKGKVNSTSLGFAHLEGAISLNKRGSFFFSYSVFGPDASQIGQSTIHGRYRLPQAVGSRELSIE